MFRKNSSKTLSVLFFILAVIAATLIYIDSSDEPGTFKTDIVEIDTAKITKLKIYPKATNHQEILLYRKDNKWNVTFDNKTYPASEMKVEGLIQTLASLKAIRVAAQDESKWSEFKVDTSGTRVKVFQGDEQTLDIILGKFSFQQPRTMLSYVRLNGDENIYEVNGLLELSFNQKADGFRNNIIVSDNSNNWESLSFTYPADSSFKLVKDTSGHWYVGTNKTDSAKTAAYLNTLSRLSSSDFIEPESGLLNNQKYGLYIETSGTEKSAGGKGTIVISGFGDLPVIHSSQNPESYFNGSFNDLWKKIFIGKDALFN